MSELRENEADKHSVGAERDGGEETGGSDKGHNSLRAVDSPALLSGPESIAAESEPTQLRSRGLRPAAAKNVRPGRGPARSYASVFVLPPGHPDDAAASENASPEPEPHTAAAAAAAAAQWTPLFRFKPLAAVVASAAAFGGLAGSLATAGFSFFAPPPPSVNVAVEQPNYPAMTRTLDRIDRDVTALKSGVDGTGKANGQQTARIAERLERIEKLQADTTGKLGKAMESIDRIERRPVTAPAAAAANSSTTPADITGAVGELHSGAAAAALAGVEPKRATAPAVIDGWILRDVSNGAALIQGRSGIVEVMAGDVLPGLGRVESIRRQDGRWVVLTSRGVIAAR